MNVLAKIAAHFNVAPSAITVDDSSGFATRYNAQPANGWTVVIGGKAFDVWTSVRGNVLGALPA